MTIEINSIIESVFNVLGMIMSFIKNTISTVIPKENINLAYLIIAGVGGWFISQKTKNITAWALAIVYATIIFLLLRFV